MVSAVVDPPEWGEGGDQADQEVGNPVKFLPRPRGRHKRTRTVIAKGSKMSGVGRGIMPRRAAPHEHHRDPLGVRSLQCPDRRSPTLCRGCLARNDRTLSTSESTVPSGGFADLM